MADAQHLLTFLAGLLFRQQPTRRRRGVSILALRLRATGRMTMTMTMTMTLTMTMPMPMALPMAMPMPLGPHPRPRVRVWAPRRSARMMRLSAVRYASLGVRRGGLGVMKTLEPTKWRQTGEEVRCRPRGGPSLPRERPQPQPSASSLSRCSWARKPQFLASDTCCLKWPTWSRMALIDVPVSTE